MTTAGAQGVRVSPKHRGEGSTPSRPASISSRPGTGAVLPHVGGTTVADAETRFVVATVTGYTEGAVGTGKAPTTLYYVLDRLNAHRTVWCSHKQLQDGVFRLAHRGLVYPRDAHRVCDEFNERYAA